MIPKGQILALSADQYRQFLDSHEVLSGTEQAAMIKRVGDRIRQAVETYLYNRWQKETVAGYDWEFNLVADDAANIFAMPGRKVVFFEGILSLAQDNAGFATVMGHEIL